MVYILVVDDEEAVRSLMGTALADPQCAVDLCSNATEAMTRFSEAHYELVMTDFQMPGMNGLELAAAIRSVDKKVPIILITGTPQDISPEQITEAGVSRLLHKPVRVAELRRIRDRLLRKKK
jgi:two-component system capsular synthesis sensor histidine kinase RcsC